METKNSPENLDIKQNRLSLFYGIVFFVLYLSIGISFDHFLVGIISGIINGVLIFYLNYALPPKKFWNVLKTRRERWDNFVIWLAVFIFTFIIYGLILFILT